MNQSETEPGAPLSADSQLPPVEAPAGRFFVQLFLVPMVIVSALVLLWVLVASIANRGTDPATLVQDIERLNSDSWKKALTLAQQLRSPDQTELRQNTELAGRLAKLLEDQVDEGGEDSLRIYLCSALGKFEVDTGAAALVKAATTERQVEDVEIRRAGLQGIGTLVEQLTDAEIAKNPEMLAAVLKGTDEYAEDGEEKVRRELLRNTATYVLGVFPSEEATEKLAKLLHDPFLDVGYNAAIGLARRGDARALPFLAEMMDPPPEALVDKSIKVDPDDQNADQKKIEQQDWKSGYIIENGLRAIAKMRVDNPQADLSSIKADVEAVSKRDDVPASIQMMAKEVLRNWK